MPEMSIVLDGAGGAYAEVFRRRRMVEVPDDVPIRLETLDGGMQGGKPSIAFIIELPTEGIVVLAQTSLKLFQLVAAATLGKYGDCTGGGGKLRATFDAARGPQDIQYFDMEPCPTCKKTIPKPANFCPACGVNL